MKGIDMVARMILQSLPNSTSPTFILPIDQAKAIYDWRITSAISEPH